MEIASRRTRRRTRSLSAPRRGKRRRPALRLFLMLLLAALLLGGSYTAWRIHQIYTTWDAGRELLNQAGAPPADVAIVLGSRAWGEEPSPSLKERLDVAARLYREGRVRHVILTGGIDTGNTISEAEVEARYLAAQHGIPQEAMAMETTSTSTAGNLRNARAIMTVRGWESAMVVTHGYHLHRALGLAAEEGVPAAGIAAETTVLFLPYHIAREVAALTWYALPGIKAP